MTARPMTLAPATDERRALDAAIDTVQFARAHNDRVIQQAYDYGDDLRLAHNERTPESVRAELVAAMDRQILAGKLGFVSVWEKHGAQDVEAQHDTGLAIDEALLHPSFRPHLLALLAKDDTLRQVLCHIHADLNAEGIAQARGFRDEDDGYALGVGA